MLCYVMLRCINFYAEVIEHSLLSNFHNSKRQREKIISWVEEEGLNL